MSDTISRQAALDALDKVAEMFPYRIPGKAKTYRQYNEAWSDAIDAAENALEALPSAQQWIPVTERLPEYFVPVLTWDGQNQCVEMRIPYVITTEGETIKSDWWCVDYWEDKEESLYNPHDLRDGAALAWMPLPTPYREGGQE